MVEKIQPIVEGYGTPAQRAGFFSNLVGITNRRDRFAGSDEALAYAQATLAAHQELGDAFGIAEARFELGFCHLWRGELAAAQEHIEAALAWAERAGHAWRQSACLTYLTITHRKRGQVNAVRDRIPRCLIAASTAQTPQYTAMATANRAWVAWREGNFAEAQANAQAALELWQQGQADYRPFYWTALWPLLGVAVAQDHIADAIDHARTLLEPTRQPLPAALTAMLEEAINYWDHGQPDAARTHLQRASELAREMGYL